MKIPTLVSRDGPSNPSPMETAAPAENAFFEFSADRSTIKRSAINSVLIQGILKMKGLITMPVFTYFLMPKEMGIYNIILVTAALLAPLWTLNLPDGSVLFFAQENSQPRIQRMYMTILNSVGILSLALGLITCALIALFRGGALPRAFWIAMILYPMIFYKLAEFLLVTFQKTDIVLKNALIRDLATVVASMILVAAGLSYQGLVLAGTLFMVIMALSLFRKIFRKMAYSLVIDRSCLTSFMKVSLPLLPVFFFSWIIQSSDSYFLLRFRGESEVGKYSVVYGLCNVILVLTFALNFFWFPVSAKLWAKDRERYRKAFLSVFAAFCVLLFLGVVLFEFNSGLIMKVLARKPAYQDAHVIMGIIAFAFAMQVLITLITAPLYSNRNSNMIFLAYLSGGTLNTALNFALIPRYGIVGAAVSTALSYFLVVTLMSWLNIRVARFRFIDGRLFPAGLAFLVLWGGAALLRGGLSSVQIIAGDVLLLFAVGGIIYAFVLRKTEKDYMHAMFKELRAHRFSGTAS